MYSTMYLKFSKMLILVCFFIPLKVALSSDEADFKGSPVIVSPDFQDKNSSAKNEVDELRKAINEDEKLIVTLDQLHDTSDIRHKIEKAVQLNEYVNGKPVPVNVHLQLHADKGNDERAPLKLLDDPKSEEIGKAKVKSYEIDVTSLEKHKSITTKDSNSQHGDTKDPLSKIITTSPWLKNRGTGPSIFLRRPTYIKTILTYPSWLKFRHNLFVQKKIQ